MLISPFSFGIFNVGVWAKGASQKFLTPAMPVFFYKMGFSPRRGDTLLPVPNFTFIGARISIIIIIIITVYLWIFVLAMRQPIKFRTYCTKNLSEMLTSVVC